MELEEPGVCSSSSERLLTLQASDSVSELKRQRREENHKMLNINNRLFTAKQCRGVKVLWDLSLFGRLPEGEPDWFPGSLLSFRVIAGSEVGIGLTAWGALSRTVKSAGGNMK